MMVLYNLLPVNSYIRGALIRSFSSAIKMKMWQRSTMTQKPFISSVILDFYKHETERAGVY